MFFISILLGATMGISYDFLRILRRVIGHSNFFISLEDILFWIIWALIVIDNIHIYNSGELRGYVFLGLGLGCLIYIYTIGWVLWKCVSHILRFARKHHQNIKKSLKNVDKKSKI